MSHVENSMLVEFSFGAESLFKLFNMFITSMYEYIRVYSWTVTRVFAYHINMSCMWSIILFALLPFLINQFQTIQRNSQFIVTSGSKILNKEFKKEKVQ